MTRAFKFVEIIGNGIQYGRHDLIWSTLKQHKTHEPIDSSNRIQSMKSALMQFADNAGPDQPQIYVV